MLEARNPMQHHSATHNASWSPACPFPPAADDVLRLLSRGAASRHTAATRLNDTSSRSHMVMQCLVESRTVEEGAGVVHRRSKLSLVDLAGSERQKASDTECDRLKEAQAINKSLFTLGQVRQWVVGAQWLWEPVCLLARPVPAGLRVKGAGGGRAQAMPGAAGQTTAGRLACHPPAPVHPTNPCLIILARLSRHTLCMQVINKLTEGSSHVPYRESKLTLLLRESLGGNSRTGAPGRQHAAASPGNPCNACMHGPAGPAPLHATSPPSRCLPCLPACLPCLPAVIIPTVAPTASCFSETGSTLKFAHRAKQIKNRAIVNEDRSQSALEMAAELARLRQEVSVLLGAAAAAGSGAAGGGSGDWLVVNAQLEERCQHLQEQLGRLRQ
jgi:hypothetical protein